MGFWRVWKGGEDIWGGGERSLRELRKAHGGKVRHSDNSHLVDRQRGTGDGKDGLDICRRQGLGYLTHRGVVLGRGTGIR